MNAADARSAVACRRTCVRIVVHILSCVSSFLWYCVAAHADWPHLRGPTYDGVSTERELADAWPADGPPRLWSRELGQGYSGFIVAQGKLFTQRQTLGGQYLLCLDPDTGATIWETRCDWAWQPKGAYPGPYATPTYAHGKVFFASTSGVVGCVDANSGAPIWSLNVRAKFAGKGFGFGYAATPLLEDDKVILPVGGPDASLVALHVDDGRTAWTVGSDPASYCPAFPITFAGKRCVVGYLQNAMIIVELATGKLLCRQALSSGYDEHSAWPIWREPHLLLAAPFRVPATRFELTAEPNGALACKTQWLAKDMANDVASCVLYGKHLYGFDLRQLQASKHRASRGSFKCLDWDTGKVCWTTDTVGHASLMSADGKLLLLNDTGSLILARADATEYRELGRVQLFDDEICWTQPTLWRGKLFVRSPSRAVCLYVGRPDQEPAAHTPVPAARGWRFDSSWLLTREREFPHDAPTWAEMSLWFACGLLALGAAGLSVLAMQRFIKRQIATALLFFLITMLLGFLGPNVVSTLLDQTIFTWPVCLYAAFHAALYACCWAEGPETKVRARWLARSLGAGFLLVGWSYYQLCNLVGMFIAWSFLVGFPFAFPLTLLAVHAALKGQARWIVAAWTSLAFAAFFWSAQALLLWKASQTP